jgi:hypothetical protein
MHGGNCGRADAEVMRRRRALEGAIVFDDPVNAELDNANMQCVVRDSSGPRLTVACSCLTRSLGEA